MSLLKDRVVARKKITFDFVISLVGHAVNLNRPESVDL